MVQVTDAAVGSAIEKLENWFATLSDEEQAVVAALLRPALELAAVDGYGASPLLLALARTTLPGHVYASGTAVTRATSISASTTAPADQEARLSRRSTTSAPPRA